MQFPFDQSLTMPNKSQQALSMNLYGKMLQTLAMPEMMKTQQDTSKADLQQKQLANQFYPQATQSDINYKNALTGETKEKTSWMGIDELLSVLGQQNQTDKISQSKYRFGPSYQTTKAFSSLTTPEKEQWYGDHAGAYQALMAASGNEALQDQIMKNASGSEVQSSRANQLGQMAQQMILQKMGIKMPQGASNTAPANASGLSSLLVNPSQPSSLTISPQQAQALQGTVFAQPGGQAPSLQPAQPQAQMPNQSPPEAAPTAPYSGETSFTPTNEQVGRSEYAAKLQSNRKNNSANINSRIDQGEAMSSLFEQPNVLKNLSVLTQYSGAEGKAKLLWAKLFDPKQYLQYQNASEQLPQLISGSLKGMEGIPTSNEGLRAGKEFLNKADALSTLKGDPSAVAQYLVNGMDLLNDEQNALLKSGQRIYPDLIPQHKHIKTMLDDIAGGKKPEDTLVLGKNPDTGKVTTGIEKGNKTYKLSDGNSYTPTQLKRLAAGQDAGAP